MLVDVASNAGARLFIVSYSYQILHLQRLIHNVSLISWQESAVSSGVGIRDHCVLGVDTIPLDNLEFFSSLNTGWLSLSVLNHQLSSLARPTSY